VREGTSLGNLGVTAADLGDSEQAKSLLEAAVDRLRAANDTKDLATFLGNLGLVYRDLGDVAKGKVLVGEALEALRACGARIMYGPALAWMGFLLHEEGDAVGACRLYEEARDVLGEVGDRLHDLQFLGPLAAALAQLERTSEAARVLQAARDRVAKMGSPTLARSFQIHAGQLDVAQARSLLAAGDSLAAASAASRAREVLQSRDSESSDEVRLARRLLERALARLDVSSAPISDERGRRGLLQVGAEGRWFQLPNEARVDLQRRRAPRRILFALVQQRVAHGVRALSLEQLIGAGWPGERMQAESATARAYVALNRLRDLGLRAVLARRDDGYLLDPAYDVSLLE
jgi:tetratricopeptide (TPR) repeat protein